MLGVGFPRFQEKERDDRNRPVRESRRVDGYLPVGEGLAEGLATLRVADPPVEIPPGRVADSPWQGMSGTVIFAGALAVGVVSEHHRPAGTNALSVVPVGWIDRCPEASDWWAALGVADPAGLPGLPRVAAPRAPGPPKRILIVEDQIGPTLKYLLAGDECELVTSLGMWWQLVEEGELNFDGALVDLHLTESMTDKQGGEILQYLRDETQVPALLMSANPAGLSSELIRAYGVVDVYYKGQGNQLAGIRQAVKELLEREPGVKAARAAAQPGSAPHRDRRNLPR